MSETRSVVLLSGGMDSTLTAAIAKGESDHVAALHLNYRNRTEARELRAFHEVTQKLAITQTLIVDIEFLRAIGGSSLTDSSIEVSKADLTNSLIPSSYVPFRNGNFISIAASWAEVIGANAIYIGAVEEDSSGYPDCRRVFFDAFERVLNLGTRPETKLEIRTPVIDLKKTLTCDRGADRIDLVVLSVGRCGVRRMRFMCLAFERIPGCRS
jgi:7-cyano-7-deazaguanine synthase